MRAWSRRLLFAVACVTPAVRAAEPERPLPPALWLTYSGKLSPVAPNKGDERAFRIHYVCRAAGTGYELAWVLDELSGSPAWPWPHRFGAMRADGSLHVTAPQEAPAVQGSLDGTVRVVSLRSPLYESADRLRAKAEWDEGKAHYDVVGREEMARRRCWKVTVSANLGLKAVDWVDERQPVVVRHEEVTFLGQGVPHELSLELEQAKTMSADELARRLAHHARLVALRGPAPERSTEPTAASPVPATSELLDKSRSALADIQKDKDAGPFARLARDIVKEVEASLEQQGSLEHLAASAVGKPANEFTLPLARGGKLSLAALKGKPIVLHFWEYHAEPLTAPYGETGYLDFLKRKYANQDVHIVGIAVDERLRDETTRPAARKDVRAFCEFMNLSYPVAFDETGAIREFGDPRKAGAKLPLYVLIAPDGKVVAHHAGVWSKTGDEGLKELDERLSKLRP